MHVWGKSGIVDAIIGVLPLQKKADSALQQVIVLILELNIGIHETTIGDTDRQYLRLENDSYPVLGKKHIVGVHSLFLRTKLWLIYMLFWVCPIKRTLT